MALPNCLPGKAVEGDPVGGLGLTPSCAVAYPRPGAAWLPAGVATLFPTTLLLVPGHLTLASYCHDPESSRQQGENRNVASGVHHCTVLQQRSGLCSKPSALACHVTRVRFTTLRPQNFTKMYIIMLGLTRVEGGMESKSTFDCTV